MRQRPWQLQRAVLLAVLCCGLNDAAAKQTTTATVGITFLSMYAAGREPSELYFLSVLLTIDTAAGHAAHTMRYGSKEGGR